MASTSVHQPTRAETDVHVGRRLQLLETTRAVMGDFGVRGATMSAIAKAAGVSRQTVYEYFPSQGELIRETLMYGAGLLINAGFEAAQVQGGDAQERLTTMISTSLSFLRSSALWSTDGKRTELAPHVSLAGGVYLGAGIVAISHAMTAWWPETDEVRVARAADTLARLLVSHGLAPTDEHVDVLATEIGQLLAHGLA